MSCNGVYFITNAKVRVFEDIVKPVENTFNKQLSTNECKT